ncbi:MAG: nucleotidyltransferase [Flavobacterium nitrogenifigens]|uniref:nucleotidyltransferase n=1 Tax=Flavobacterium nitrogenifigens TaxID=1617283 RepID=UPI00280667CE|nr:nucleotidyltransferase [Flavobacterium nitrogenifigens]MDQ8012050.1 nucleotidyltransferase [Flavobacterium nitrogenifigens]
MARTRAQIKAEITTPFMANEVLAAKYGFAVGASFESEFSLVSLENIWFEIVTIAHFIHESFFDQHAKEVNERLANEMPGTLPWYRTMALRFQFGFSLKDDTDKFDNATATPEQIENSKIIKYSAVNEASDSTRVIIKIAGEQNGELTNFTDSTQIEAIENYFKRIKIAGTPLTIINYRADQLSFAMQIKVDPLVIDLNGMSILNGNYPVVDASEQFMKELDFNGELRLSALVDKVQIIPGVVDATLLSAESAWINPEIGDYGLPQPINVSKIAESGYFKIVTFDNIAYVV